MSTLPARLTPQTFDTDIHERRRPFGFDYAPQSPTYLLYLPFLLGLCGGAVWVLPTNAMFVLGALVALTGAVWTLQGLGYINGSFMTGATLWAVIGPIVRNELFFFVFIFGAAALLIFREWHSARQASAVTRAANEAEKRRLMAQSRRQLRWMVAAASACMVVILVLTADFIYARANSARPMRSCLATRSGRLRRGSIVSTRRRSKR